ncbi:MAG: hypothetical protein M3144_00970 [Actinomycetota bacterium]|nr:hypothetical protein [Actinomycetota bacterium]
MTEEPEYVEFTEGSADEVLDRMARLAAAQQGWMNFEPAVDVDDLPPPRSPLFGLLSGRGPDVPLATWAAGTAPKGRGRPEPPTIGLLHPAGARARAALAEQGHPVPDGWVVLQDFSKKGLVVAVPPAVAHADVVAWLLRAARLLSAVPLTGQWRAAVYEG